MVIAPEDFARRVREATQTDEQHLPNHPVVVAMAERRLSRDGLRNWATQNYLFLKDHARVFGLVYGRCPDPDVRPHILRVLVEETLGIYSKAGPHLPHLVRFCQALGVDDPDQAKPNPATKGAFAWWIKTAAKSSWLEGWATWAFSNRRAAFGRVYEALKQGYGLSEDDLFFWKLHGEHSTPAEERAKEFAAVSQYLGSQGAQDRVRRAALGLGKHWMTLWSEAVR